MFSTVQATLNGFLHRLCICGKLFLDSASVRRETPLKLSSNTKWTSSDHDVS